ncbi:MAG TPA: MBOAT family O-acyltransferase [Polyangiaceae bacterium]|jgi:alginate O-acetyltransferase complex protein AlgI|nr:MBOAT family O-acyltransferase [Polyangiaceae bacterium]
MVFSSPIFLFAFLPVVLGLSLLFRGRAANAFLLCASLVFYFWGETTYGWVIVASIAFNYGMGLALAGGGRRRLVAFAIFANLALLGWFKYAALAVDGVNRVLAVFGGKGLAVPVVHLPIGISFFTFHALSYVIDTHRGRTPPQKNFVDFALYVTLFPQLIAGPIVRYHDISAQLHEHRVGADGFALGAQRFIVGLGKKVLIANTIGRAADALFAVPSKELTPSLAWAAAAAYTLQIYYDFSGYSDMAIGLGRMFGLRFLENFDYPYVAESVTEFWRRWHISLSRWFRDYLYIPLGGNRTTPARTYVNLVVVFFLCGLWHGASYTFVFWGLYHGAFLVLERAGVGALLERAPRILRHAYLLLVVIVGWVFFRTDSLASAWTYLEAMAGHAHGTGRVFRLSQYLNDEVLLATAVGVVGAAPVLPWLGGLRAGWVSGEGPRRAALRVGWDVLALSATGLVLLGSAALLASGTYNPFIYFRF